MSMYRRPEKPQSRDEEFQEQDVWGVSNEGKMPTFISNRQPITNRKMIQSTIKKGSNIDEPKIFRNSAPLSIPDWSEIYGTSTAKSTLENAHDVVRSSSESDNEDEEEDEDGNILPPHEYIARKLAKMPSFSVCEGTGRTLKGRDLSRVRNAVLTKTGFLE